MNMNSYGKNTKNINTNMIFQQNNEKKRKEKKRKFCFNYLIII